jgi:hypothetical protein
MPNAPHPSVENNFTGGLKTEFTGLNFPENACTQADNCVFSIIGDVSRREGFDFEENYRFNVLTSPTNKAISTYKWNNVGGDGSTQIVVQQTGAILYFYLSSSATTSAPLSTKIIPSAVDISSFIATNAILAFDASVECTFTDGNGYLFVFNAQCDPFYVVYNSLTQTFTATRITVKTRDFVGVPDGLQGQMVSQRPTSLSNEHQYNLVNQGWSNLTQANSITTNTIGGGSFTWTLSPAIPIPFVVGSTIIANGYGPISGGGKGVLGSITGTVTTSSTTSITITETANTGAGTLSFWYIATSPALLQLWNNALSNYPSNADQWWTYRDTSLTTVTMAANTLMGAFNPLLAKTGTSVQGGVLSTPFIIPATTQAPQGSMILNAFVQQRTSVSGVPGITDVTTTARPTNGCWYAGRVWFSGVNSNFQPSGDEPFSTWTETIYFSQIVTVADQFGYCYQQNDPTSATLYNLLPSDGGTIVIQGSGPIYKLFPIQNGILVFAANGIWYITGGQAVGFTATQYSVNKISGIQSIGYHSYVNVLGWPVFWNEEGIYEVKPDKGNTPYGQGGYMVENLCLGTILSFFNEIPLQSKMFARGDYNPITYTIQWLYRSTNETDITSRYTFDSALNINTYKGPFFPYSFTTTQNVPYLCSMLYVASPGGTVAPESQFEYLTVYFGEFTFSQERDSTNWKDWASTSAVDYTSTFTTGYKLHGQAWRLFWLGYIYVYSNNVDWPQTSYGIRGLWNYGNSGNSGKWSTQQIVINNIPNFGNVMRKIRIRGHGLALQLQFNSVSGLPFNFAGWSMYVNVNQGV